MEANGYSLRLTRLRPKHVTKLFVGLLAIMGLLAAHNTSAQTSRRVQFAKGASSTTIKGRVKGYDYIDYIVGARAGQTLSVRLTGRSVADFVIRLPDGENLGMDSTGVRDWTGQLPESGDYSIRVLMPRAYARRGTVASFSLRISIQ